jgi:hypothetical protein
MYSSALSSLWELSRGMLSLTVLLSSDDDGVLSRTALLSTFTFSFLLNSSKLKKLAIAKS